MYRCFIFFLSYTVSRVRTKSADIAPGSE